MLYKKSNVSLSELYNSHRLIHPVLGELGIIRAVDNT